LFFLSKTILGTDKNTVTLTPTHLNNITYIRLANGKMRYNGRILDVYDWSIVVSVNGTYLHTEWAKKALEKARKSENPKEGRILHSGPFTSWEFVSYCKEKKGTGRKPGPFFG